MHGQQNVKNIWLNSVMLEFNTISVLHAHNTLWNVLFVSTPDRTQIYVAISC